MRAGQKSLNQMSRDDRVDFIRANGDPKVSVSITVRDADMPDAPPQLSPVAENILKERIKSFGFRTWSANSPGANDTKKGADELAAFCNHLPTDTATLLIQAVAVVAVVVTAFCAVLFPYGLNLPFQLWPQGNAPQLLFNQFADLFKSVFAILGKLIPGLN